MLRGLVRTLKAHRPVLIAELDDASEVGLAKKSRELSNLLTGLGYELTELAPSYPAGDWWVGHFVARAGT